MNSFLKIFWFYLQTKYRRPFRDRASLVKWQDKKVSRFLKEILAKSPFYRSYYQGLNIHDWQDFPIIDKAILMI
jgi:phenylacetate-coenzyme A ligase PaaK-like adenylate-forming protein